MQHSSTASLDLQSDRRTLSCASIPTFLSEFCVVVSECQISADLQEKMVSAFLRSLHKTLLSAKVCSHASNAQQCPMLHSIRRHILIQLFPVLFPKDVSVEDEGLQRKLADYSWVTLSHLDVEEESDLIRSTLGRAQDELYCINLFKSPHEKLLCIRRAVDLVLAAFSLDSGGSTGADSLLPAVIYVILQANPPELLANIDFCQTFWQRGDSPEDGWIEYCFVQFRSAVSFLQNMSAASFNGGARSGSLCAPDSASDDRLSLSQQQQQQQQQ